MQRAQCSDAYIRSTANKILRIVASFNSRQSSLAMSTEADKEVTAPAASEEESQTNTEIPRSEEPQATEESANEEAPAAAAPAEEGPPIVLVTGASGFLASHVVQQLLQQGRFRVRGTVRDKNREDKVKPLTELATANHPLELVAADLTKEDTWTDAVKGCSYVLHVASPYPRMTKQPKNPDVVIRPAVDGALNVLKACAESGSVKRVVLTSSAMAISGGISGEPGKVYTEEDWATDENCKGAYERSKFRAERAAWEFVEKLEAGKKFELVTVNPSGIMGPFISASSGDTSASSIGDILTNKLPGLPNISLPIVDVRDVAAAHIAAIESPEAAGKRYIAHNKTMTYSEIAAIISQEFKPQGYKVPTKPMKKIMLGVMSKFNSGAKYAAKNAGNEIQLSNDRMRSQLGIEPRAEEATIIDQCYTLIDLGLVKKKPGYLGHPDKRPKEEPKAADKAVAKTDEKTVNDKQVENSETKESAAEPKNDETKTVESEPKAEEPPVEEPKAEEPPLEEPKAEEPPVEEPKAVEPPVEEPKAEEPPVEEPKAEEPPVEEPKAEEPPVEEPKAEEPPVEEPKAEEPPVEEPKAEEPPVEEPKAEEPPVEEPKAEEPPVEEPKAEEPPVEEPKAEEPPVEEPKAEEPPVEEPKAEEPPVEEPKAEEPAAEEPKAEEPPAEEEPAAEEPKAEEPAAEEPKAEEPPAEEPAAEEPKAEEEPPAEEPKAEEPAAEEPKAEEPAAEEPKEEEPAAEEPKTEEAEAENSDS